MVEFVNAVDAFIDDYFNVKLPDVSITDIIEIVIISYFMYHLLVWIKNSRVWMLVRGVIFILIFFVFAAIFEMNTILWLGEKLVSVAVTVLIVVFQPELRNIFEKLGRSKVVDVFDMDDNILVKHAISEVTKAVEIMSMKQIGALIVFERDTKVSEVMKEGIPLNAKVTAELIQNIFMPRTPLHDGAIVISGSEILAAKCILPLASEVSVPRNVGTRHRAAVGITEISDALVVVVSEETGTISIAEGGKLTRDLTPDGLRELLDKKLDRTKNRNVIKNIVKK